MVNKYLQVRATKDLRLCLDRPVSKGTIGLVMKHRHLPKDPELMYLVKWVGRIGYVSVKSSECQVISRASA